MLLSGVYKCNPTPEGSKQFVVHIRLGSGLRVMWPDMLVYQSVAPQPKPKHMRPAALCAHRQQADGQATATQADALLTETQTATCEEPAHKHQSCRAVAWMPHLLSAVWYSCPVPLEDACCSAAMAACSSTPAGSCTVTPTSWELELCSRCLPAAAKPVADETLTAEGSAKQHATGHEVAECC